MEDKPARRGRGLTQRNGVQVICAVRKMNSPRTGITRLEQDSLDLFLDVQIVLFESKTSDYCLDRC